MSAPPPPTYSFPPRTTSLHTHPLPAYTPSRWGNYSTEAEYLTALRAWVEEKQYAAPAEKSALVGFYGTKTMGDYVSGAGGRREERKREMDVGSKGEKGLGGWWRRRRGDF